MLEFNYVRGKRPENNSEVLDPPCGREVSDSALAYVARLDRRDEKMETLAKASAVIDRQLKEAPNADLEDYQQIARLQAAKRLLAQGVGKVG